MAEKKKINLNSISIVGGFCFILFALVTLFAKGTPFHFLNDLITHSFGFVGFWFLLPYFVVLGFYLIFNKSFIKLKLGVTLWGILIIIITLLILTSHWASWTTVVNGVEITGSGHTLDGTAKYLTFSNAIEIFNQIAADSSASFGPSTKLGGGKVGFIFAGALNSAITPIGLNIVCWVLLFAALVMVFNVQIAKLSQNIKKHRLKKVEKNNYEEVYKEVELKSDESVSAKEEPPFEIERNSSFEVEKEQPILPQPQPEPVETPAPTISNDRPIFESFHTSPPINNDYDLKKARFVMADEENPIESKSIVEPSFEQINETVSEPIVDETPKVFEEQPVPECAPETKEENNISPFANEFVEKPSFEEPIVKEQVLEEPVKEPEPEEVPFENRPQPKANFIKNYIYPSIDLLDKIDNAEAKSVNEASCSERIEVINTAFNNLGIGAEVVSYTIGPSVTRFDVQTHADSSVAAIQKYITDISIRLNGASLRFEPIVAGKPTSGLEIPNEHSIPVSIREVVEQLPTGPEHNLDIPFGISISGELKYANLAKFPHMLVAGCTGSGKSIFVHAILITLLLRNKPEELKLILVDPKKVEMSYYDDIPHLLCPVISDMQKVFICFTKLVSEMERRYTLFQTNRVRDIQGFNKIANEKDIQPLPYIVTVIDEYADLVENVKQIKEPVTKLVQKARAAGIHIVFATQRPSVDVVDGTIKANVSTRVALSCASSVDSQTILDCGGAEKLLGHGDMIISSPEISRSMKPRAQGCFVSEVEINRVCDFLRDRYPTQFDPIFLNLEPPVEKKPFEEVEAAPIDKSKSDDEIYERIKEDASHREFFSISYITRTYGMGFTRAGKMFYRLQAEGIVAMQGDAKGCRVLTYVPGGQQEGTIEQSTFIPDDGGSTNED